MLVAGVLGSSILMLLIVGALPRAMVYSERILEGEIKPSGAFYQYFDGIIEELEKAVALLGIVPEVDAQADRLLAALREVNPILKAVKRYRTTREFKEDAFKFAREQHAILVPRVEAAAKTMDAYGTALFEREIDRDERRLAALPEDVPARRLLSTSLTLRRAVRRFEALGPGADVAPFLAALGEVSNANRQLGTTFDSMSPKANSSCTGYTDTVASVIEHGRDVSWDIRAKGDPSNQRNASTRPTTAPSETSKLVGRTRAGLTWAELGRQSPRLHSLQQMTRRSPLSPPSVALRSVHCALTV
jgi:hypothetical protein